MAAPGWILRALEEARESAARASGPGGQHVNKTSTAIELRLDVAGSSVIPDAVKERLPALAGGRLTARGELIFFAETFRSQELNRREARRRLEALLLAAAKAPKIRRPTRPSRAAKAERLAGKSRRASVKGLRARPKFDD